VSTRPDAAFYSHITRELARGRLTPFLGAGVNLISHTAEDAFKPGRRLPSSSELAQHLATEFSYPSDDRDLVRVAQWVYARLGSDTLYDYLHEIFDHDFPPTAVHDVLAQMPAFVRREGGTDYPLIITTNYDDALERAFTAAGEPFDLLSYIATEPHLGMFWHVDADGGGHLVEVPNRYKGVTLRERPAIAKIHGAVQRGLLPHVGIDDSYVVTEDDYIDCLTRTDVVALLPPGVVQRMQRCHYLFLGYSLRDWNLRAILHRIRRARALVNISWAVQRTPDPLEEQAWQSRHVDIFDIDLVEFASVLAAGLSPGDAETPGAAEAGGAAEAAR
jgi:hypothetical protein